MKPLTNLGYMNLRFLSKPAADRVIYKTIKAHQVRSMVEIGMGDGSRCVNMIRAAKKFGIKNIRYTGVDLFDGRPEDQDELLLKSMHKRVNQMEIKSQLVPGDTLNAIRRIANSHTRTDLIVISAGYDPELLQAAWFYAPRMLHANSVVLKQPSENGSGTFELLNRLEVERLVAGNDSQSKQSVAA